MARPYVLTVDAGSGSCRALVFDARVNLVSLAQEEWPYEQTPGVPGGFDFNTTRGWELVVGCIRQALVRAGLTGANIGAVSATSMREGFVLYNEAGQEIWACPNVDARAGKEAVELIEQGLAEPIYRRGGDWTSITAPARLRWIERHDPETFTAARHMTMIGDWVLTRLSGEFATDPSLGSSSGLFDLSTRSWSTETAEQLGLPDIFPPIHETGTPFGAVTQRVAEETGLVAGTPVVAGGGDTQLGLLGASVESGNHFGVVAGTYWLTAYAADTPVVDPEIRLRTLCHALPDRWMIEGVGFVHGLSTKWVRDGLFQRGEGVGRQIDGGRAQKQIEGAFAQLDELAEQIPPGSNGLYYLCSNVMNARAWRHGPTAIVGLNVLDAAGTGTGAIFRAVMEEAAYVARGHLDILRDVLPQRPDHVTFVGGPSRSRVWARILSDTLNLPVRVPAINEATCVGAAIAALVGLGEYKQLSEACGELIRTAYTVEPQPPAVQAYDEHYARWRGLYNHLLAAAEDGNADFFWKGAGA